MPSLSWLISWQTAEVQRRSRVRLEHAIVAVVLDGKRFALLCERRLQKATPVDDSSMETAIVRLAASINGRFVRVWTTKSF